MANQCCNTHLDGLGAIPPAQLTSYHNNGTSMTFGVTSDWFRYPESGMCGGLTFAPWYAHSAMTRTNNTQGRFEGTVTCSAEDARLGKHHNAYIEMQRMTGPQLCLKYMNFPDVSLSARTEARLAKSAITTRSQPSYTGRKPHHTILSGRHSLY